MANTLYANLLSQVTRVFTCDFVLRQNIPEDISTWIYNIYGINIKGKLAQVYNDTYIIKECSEHMEYDYITDTVLMGDNEIRIILINNSYLESVNTEELYGLLYDIYNHILTERFVYKPGSLYITNQYAPFILALTTMDNLMLHFNPNAIQANYKDVYDYLNRAEQKLTVEELLNNGGIVAILNEL